MPYITKKIRVILLVTSAVGFVYCCQINDGFFLTALPAALMLHSAIPNFHDGEHYLDKKLNWWQSALLAVILFAAIIKYLFFWEDFQIMIKDDKNSQFPTRNFISERSCGKAAKEEKSLCCRHYLAGLAVLFLLRIAISITGRYRKL